MWNVTQALVREKGISHSFHMHESQWHYLFHTVNLGPDDLRSVRSAIYSIRNKWYDVGVELNISFQTLNAIRTDCPNNCADCLREMLVVWLSRTSPPPSWSGLVEALSSEPVGERRLAEQIHTQYCVSSHDVVDSGDTDAEATGMRYSNFCHTSCIGVLASVPGLPRYAYSVCKQLKCAKWERPGIEAIHVYNMCTCRYVYMYVFPAHVHTSGAPEPLYNTSVYQWVCLASMCNPHYNCQLS